jgi:small subunit ribosomal protein S17
MAEETENTENEETAGAEAEEAPVEEPSAESVPSTTDEESAAEEPSAGSVPSTSDEESPEAVSEGTDPTVAASDATEPSEPEEQLHPKEARKRRRAVHSGETRPQRSAEERASERVERRRANAAARRRRRAQEREKRGDRGEGTAPAEREPGVRKSQLGTVVSDKADKTITVRVDIVRRHRRYEKVVRQSATLRAHDERNEASEGDVVRVIESRPLSRTKRWRLIEVVEKAR